MMGQYMNPDKAVEFGRSLTFSPRTFENLTMALQPGEVLVAVLNRGIFKAAPIVDSPDEFDYHYQGYRNGFTLNVDFYAVKRPVFEEFRQS